VTVACQGTSISLTSATPFNGYSLSVQSSGPASVSVRFTGNGQYHTIRAACSSTGQPFQSGGGSGGGSDDGPGDD
jgi:hypothetical protein